MATNRSTGFIAAALMAAGTTTALCCRDALARAPADGGAIASAPSGATPHPLQVLHNARPWLIGTAPALRGRVVP